MSDSVYVNEKTASAIIGYSHWTLRRWRVKGGGPPFLKPPGTNKVQYNKAKLLEWAAKHERGSTSEYETWQKPGTMPA
jgi:hypothetical protein